jgi:serine/threonine protein kinase
MASPEPEDGDPRPAKVIAGRYELIDELARGGMGTIWVAQDQKLARKVALKIMRPESLEAFPDARERFEREAQAAAALRSMHVVQVHDYGVDDGTPFIAMELLEGESLKARLERSGTLEVLDVAAILRQVAKGLKAAHSAGLVHRDLKPSNIFLTQRDDVELVKLLDFGVVKTAMRRGKEETASGVLLGTPQYMSPEQARGIRKVDHRSDLWSVAVIMYTALTGENPFNSDADAVGDIVIRVCIDPIPEPSVINPDLPPSLDDFFEKALERDPDRRFQTAEELTESFMIHADLSFAGLDERTGDISGPGLLLDGGSGSHSRSVRVSGPGDTGPQQRVSGIEVVDDPSSVGMRSSMSTSVGELEAVRTEPRPRIQMVLAAAACLIGGLAAYLLIGGDHEPVSPTGAAQSGAFPKASELPLSAGSAIPNVKIVPPSPPAASIAHKPVDKPVAKDTGPGPVDSNPVDPNPVDPKPVDPKPPSSVSEEDKPPVWFNKTDGAGR